MQVTTQSTQDEAAAKIAELELALAKSEAVSNKLRNQLERVREAYRLQCEELELLRRRIFVAKAERIDTKQMQLEFLELAAEVNALKQTLDDADHSDSRADEEAPAQGDKGNNDRPKPKGRRNLRDANIPEVRLDLLDAEKEALVAQGKASRTGAELTYKIGWQRGGLRKLVIARATYRLIGEDGSTSFERAALPPQAFERSLAAPSLLAYIAYAKFGLGLPLFRLENDLGKRVFEIARGTMSRWLEDMGATVGATIIEAARREAMAKAFCISTDATGVLVQPPPAKDGRRSACRRGHFFVQIADRDHVFFEYTAKEDSKSVAKMFEGFTGFVQADAKSVYNILFEPLPSDDENDAGQVMTEVGCFAHCRRKFWEAAVILKDKIAEEGLFRIRCIYELDRQWRELPVEEITRLRNEKLRPLVEKFFQWANEQYAIEKPRRGLLRKALGYACRQQVPLMRFLDDGRLNIDNNASERGLKPIATGRKAWLFVGSDDHGSAAGHLLSLIASAKLHGLDPEQYLRDIVRVLGHWPKDRYIELSAKNWLLTRSRLNPIQLAAEVGHLDVPPPPPEQ